MHPRLNTRFTLLIAIDQIFPSFRGQKLRNFPADEENTHELFTVLMIKLATVLFKITEIRQHNREPSVELFLVMHAWLVQELFLILK